MTEKANRVFVSFFIFFLVLGTGALPALGEDNRIGISGPNGALLGWIMSNSRLSSKSELSSLETLVQRAEMAYMDGAVRSTAALMYAAIIDPAFSEFRTSPLWDDARYLLAASLAYREAFGRARRIFLDLISKVPPSDFAGPALRKLVDLTLASKQFKQTLVAIEQTRISKSNDQKDEILYLKAKALMKLGFFQKATEAFGRISNESPLYASAVFMQGIISLEAGRTHEAEDLFCKLTHGSSEHKTPFFISDNASRVIENAWLALARIKHDQGRFEEAIDTYYSISPDSSIFPIVLYESAWSMFRLGDFSGAIKTLEELLESHAEFPDRPMAKILIAYSLLGQCNFEDSKKIFGEVEQQQESILALARDSQRSAGPIPKEVLALITSKKLESRTIKLVSKVEESFVWLRWLRWQFRKLSSNDLLGKKNPLALKTEQALKYDLQRAEGMLQRLADMRVKLGTAKNKLAELKKLHLMQVQVEAARKRASDALTRLRSCYVPVMDTGLNHSIPKKYMDEEFKNLDSLKKEILSQYEATKRFTAYARISLAEKSSSISASLARRAMLGKIDAVTAEKQALDTEVQNLAIGRYPLSLLSDLAKAGLLDEESEYWPFDGESWPDEYE